MWSLLVKLDFYGIHGLANCWLKSFLENRKQYVNLLGHSSSVKTVTCGIPQGSTLGPLLIFLYINDLQNAFSKLVFHHFAGDTLTFYFLSANLVQLNPLINHELRIHWRLSAVLKTSHKSVWSKVYEVNILKVYLIHYTLR